MDWSAAGLDLNRSLDEILNLAEWDGERQLTFEEFWLLVRRRRARCRPSSPTHTCTRVLCYLASCRASCLAAPRSRGCRFGRARVAPGAERANGGGGGRLQISRERAPVQVEVEHVRRVYEQINVRGDGLVDR